MTFQPDNQIQNPIAKSFRKAADQAVQKPQRSMLSLRLSPAEWTRLEREAAGRTFSAHAREKLFRPRAKRSGGAVSDHKTLARVLGALGKSPQIGTLKGVLRACDDGAIVLRPEAEDALRLTCERIDAMRADLIKALGLRPE